MPASVKNPSHSVTTWNPITFATSAAVNPHDVYSRYRNVPPRRPEKPTLLLKAEPMNDAKLTR